MRPLGDDRSGGPSLASALALLRLCSLLVPAARRPDWLAEWRAELEHARLHAHRGGEPVARLRVRLLRRAAGSLFDALWLRRRSGGGPGGLGSLRDATRSLRRRPGFALAVVGTLALGMGSATAIFTLVDALMLRPLPFHEPDRLVSLLGPGRSQSVDLDALREWQARDGVFSEVRAYSPRPVILTGAGEARRLLGWQVEPGFLELLGVAPSLGRTLTDADAEPGSGRVVLLGDELWGDAFGRDPGIVGRTVDLDGDPYTVVGVLPPALRRLPYGLAHLVLPLSDPPPVDRLSALARVRPDLPLEAAQARVDQMVRALDGERPREGGWELSLWSVERRLDAQVANGFRALAAASLCLLLIACANAAGLLFLRGVTRRPELALRLALGGSRASLIRHVLLESALLALAAGALGMLLALGAVHGMLRLLPANLVRFSYTTVGIDARVLAFAFGLTVVVGVVSGVLPALRTGTTSAVRAGRAATASPGEVRVRAAVQVGQLALAVLLLAGAGLFGRSFLRLMSVPLGYDVDHTLELQLVNLRSLRGDSASAAAFARELDVRLRALPGVVGLARHGGMGIRFDYTLEVDGGEPRESGDALLPFQSVDTAYFGVMGIRILEGRGFRAEDARDGSGAVILDRDFAASLWPDRSAVGRTIRIREEETLTVVGVTEDVKLEGPQEPLGPFVMFHPAGHDELRSGVVVLRTAGDPRRLVPAARRVVRELDPEQPIASLRTGRQALGEAVADPRFLLVMVTAFATVAVSLAAIGVYGLASFNIARRTREIGVRMALGARSARVVADVVGWGFLLASLGIAIGLGASALLSRFVSALLFGVSPLDPPALALAAAVLLAACALALVLPARRAARVDPSEALRVE